MAWRRIRGVALAGLMAGTALSAQAFADYENALETYIAAKGQQDVQSRVIGAIDLWQKSALAGDVRSARILGDLYSHQNLVPGDDDMLPEETGVVLKDSVEALAWYTIAATHDFDDYQQKTPLPAEIGARIAAQRRLPLVREMMTDGQVVAAQRRVEDLLGGGSGFDLLRLGKMRAQGIGLPKSNVEALKYLYLAKGRGRGTSAAASTMVGTLETLMAQTDVAAAKTLAEEWQPPLPDTYASLTKSERDAKDQLTKLQFQEIRAALDELTKEFKGDEEVVDKALRAVGFFFDENDNNKLDKAERVAAIKRFQTSLFIDRRGGRPLSNEERAMASDVATGILDPLQTVELMRRAAERGHAPSQHIYGVMLGRGIGTKKDGVAAIEMLKRAADQDYPLAHYSAGIFYVEGIIAERPLQQSITEACFHLRMAGYLKYEPGNKAQKAYCNFD
ncbi:tetratricopeptide repeat protein [Parvularcula maris]|nr:hypothetical protein [Parvularcula maris]